jgi:hypothetical protein
LGAARPSVLGHAGLVEIHGATGELVRTGPAGLEPARLVAPELGAVLDGVRRRMRATLRAVG